MPFSFYLSDFGLVVLAVGTLYSAYAQSRQRIVRRWPCS